VGLDHNHIEIEITCDKIIYDKENQIMTEQGHRKPPRGHKNIDVALSSLKKLEESVKECSLDTPAHTLSAARWLENAVVNKEVDEEYYDEFMSRIKIQTRIFADKCDCTGPDKENNVTGKIDYKALDKHWT
jgi:hypothetical protein